MLPTKAIGSSYLPFIIGTTILYVYKSFLESRGAWLPWEQARMIRTLCCATFRVMQRTA